MNFKKSLKKKKKNINGNITMNTQNIQYNTFFLFLDFTLETSDSICFNTKRG